MTNSTNSDLRDKLEQEVQANEAEVTRLREERGTRKELADRDVSEEERVLRKQLSSALNKARGRLEDAQELLARFNKSGQEHAVVVLGNRVTGTLAVRVAPGTSQQARLQIIEDALAEPLAAAVTELSVVLAAAPSKYVRERMGRDSEGRTVFEVEGVVEGDVLVPALRQTRRR